jgi:hypothetical protein
MIYTHPTINLLSEFVVGVTEDLELRSKADPALSIERMVAKYTVGFDTPISSPSLTTQAHVALITGTTGNIGAGILSNLLEDARITRIYALNRRDSKSRPSLERHMERFEDKGLNSSLLQSDKLRFLEGDTAEDLLGLMPDTHEEVSTICRARPSFWGILTDVHDAVKNLSQLDHPRRLAIGL